MFVDASLFVVPSGSLCRKMLSHYAEARNVKMGESRSLNGVDATVRNVSTVVNYSQAVPRLSCARAGGYSCRGTFKWTVPTGIWIGTTSLIVLQLVNTIRGATSLSVYLSPCGGMAALNSTSRNALCPPF